MKLSKFLSLNLQEFLNGLIMTVGAAVVAVIGPSIEDGKFIFDWTTIWHTAAAAGFVYLVKKFLTPTPKEIQINPEKTSVVDVKTKETIVNSN